MALSQAQRTLFNKARVLGAGKQGIALDDRECSYLVAIIAEDLDLLDQFRELPQDIPSFFKTDNVAAIELPEGDPLPLFERLVGMNADADTYFYCLATLHKSRLKYQRILRTQPLPTIDQVGPRGLLQYGSMPDSALAGFLFWRKWMFDIDNRAGQETGYLFEPIIAQAIGGTPAGAARSPVYRAGDRTRGARQVDCIREGAAYEIKIRVTIAASGQGRWSEELAFPADCRASNFKPILVVLDPTENEKLSALKKAFEEQGGAWFVGPQAWEHLGGLAGETMARFLDRYVHTPIRALLREAPRGQDLPTLTMRMDSTRAIIEVAGDRYSFPRAPEMDEATEALDAIPDDIYGGMMGT